jgi:SAM-dependent methyltransferase
VSGSQRPTAIGSPLQPRAARALERQLEFMRALAGRLRGREAEIAARMRAHSAAVRARLEAIRPIADDAPVLEVGSGATGLIFFFGGSACVGVDPLAGHQTKLFPAWQERVPTIAASGEDLPFPDECFEVVLSDNVVDHAGRPQRIVAEMARVLRRGGLFYLTVHVHHPFYHLVSGLYGLWRGLALPGEVTPFADHTVHLTPRAARRLLDGLPLRVLTASADLAEARLAARNTPPRHMGDRLKRLFYKNATFEAIAVKESVPSSGS